MAANPARSATAGDPLDVVAVAYDGLCTFEFGIVVELFGLPRPELESWYRLRVAGLERGPLRAAGGISVEVPHTLRQLDSAGTIVIPGWRDVDEPVPPELTRALQRADARGARILSVCSGVFVLAAAGLLDGKRATTHWRYAERLAQRFPAIEVDPDVLYVDAGSIMTSAGSAAGVDLGLYLIRCDFGAAVANTVARRLVVPPQRAGGQQQFIESPVEAGAKSGEAIPALLDSLRAELPADHTVASMAARAHMSQRNFARRFKQATGTTPHRWLQHERVRQVQGLLETTSLALDEICGRVGFADAQIMRLHFRRVVGTSPSAYRRTFRQAAAS